MNTGQVNPDFNPSVGGGSTPILANSNMWATAANETNRTLGTMGENAWDITYNPNRQMQMVMGAGQAIADKIHSAAALPLAAGIIGYNALRGLNPESRPGNTSLTPAQLAILQSRKH
jgi:hypothetical protein